MKGFKSYIIEQQNIHMEHIEDLVFNGGVDGTRRSIRFLIDLRDMLAGHTPHRVTATIKWDGAPAIFVGVDPKDGKFFVAKKGIFNKNPKVYKSEAEVRADTQGDLAEKLSIAYRELKKLGIKKGVYQGDLMFIRKDLKNETIDGQKYITFHPNTIVYAVPVNTKLAHTIKKANIGVVWHTEYTGKSFETMNAHFGKDINKKFKQIPTVWMDDATYKDYSGNTTLTANETAELNSLLSQLGAQFQKMSSSTLNAISKDDDLLTLVKTYNNSKIRAGEIIVDPVEHAKGLYHYIHDKYEKNIQARKTNAAKSKVEAQRSKILQFFNNHSVHDIASIFIISTLIAQAKQIIINKMNTISNIKTFLRTPNGFKVTGVEGLVAVDHLSGGAVKIVDRMEFSKANFSSDIIKGFDIPGRYNK